MSTCQIPKVTTWKKSFLPVLQPHLPHGSLGVSLGTAEPGFLAFLYWGQEVQHSISLGAKLSGHKTPTDPFHPVDQVLDTHSQPLETTITLIFGSPSESSIILFEPQLYKSIQISRIHVIIQEQDNVILAACCLSKNITVSFHYWNF